MRLLAEMPEVRMVIPKGEAVPQLPRRQRAGDHGNGAASEAPSRRYLSMADERCNCTVHRRDTYRYTGRGKGGFEMHYLNGRCSRKAKEGDLCRQHAKMEREGWNLLRFDRHAPEQKAAPT